MPRHPRLFVPGATYHVYCRVARGEFVFDDDFEATAFVEVLRKVRDLDRSLMGATFLIVALYMGARLQNLRKFTEAGHWSTF